MNKKWKAILLVCGTLAAIIVLLGGLAIPNTGINMFKTLITERDYEEAYLAYEELSPENQSKANLWMKSYISEIEEKYYKGNLDYVTSTNLLREMTYFTSAYDAASEAIDNLYLDNEATNAFERAKEYAQEEKWLEAYTELQSIHIKYRLYDEVVVLRDECVANYRASVIEQINAYAANGEINKIIEARDSALNILTDDREIIQGSQKLLDDYVLKTLADAQILAGAQNYDEAEELLQYAFSMYEAEEFLYALEDYRYEAVVSHCEALVAQDDLLGAVKYVKSFADFDLRYCDLLMQYAEPLVNNTLKEAKTYADNRQFELAIETISTVQVIYDSSELQNAISEYSKYLPCKIANCHLLDCSYEGYIKSGDHEDSFGNEHEDSVRISDSYQDTYAVYNLDGRYVRFAGTLVADADHEGRAIVKIYLDGKLVYESKEIGRSTEKIDFSIDTTGVKQLRIEVLNNRDYMYWSYIIVDATLS